MTRHAMEDRIEPTTRRRLALACLAAAWMAAGCSLDDLLGTDEIPPDVSDPGFTETAEGAVAVYHGTLAAFRNAFNVAVRDGGLLTDELGAAYNNEVYRAIDRRDFSDETINTGTSYSLLHRVRGQASLAIGLLARYAPGRETLIGHAYALQGYAEIFLADVYCSGIPLSTLDFDGDFTYRPGSTTEEVYEHAVALLDSAVVFAADSARIVHLARVGRARALLALGRFGEAAATVSEVPDDFVYAVSYAPEFAFSNFARLETSDRDHWDYTVLDREGVNGLDYVSSGDPRTVVRSLPKNSTRGVPVHFPLKYAEDGSSPIVLASGIEARLIEAEAALREGDVAKWLGILNHLRRTAWTSIEPAVTGPLPDLADPGSESARVDLLFRERAFWLFLTGQRQGDLRRLIRHYGRTPGQIYPAGAYQDASTPGLSYGADVDIPVPPSESAVNPHYNGCIARGA